MGKRKRMGLRLLEMPQLVDSLVVDIRQEPERVDESILAEDFWSATGRPTTLAEALESQRNTVDLLEHALDEASLWWVTESMGKLALAASDDMPEWDWDALRPSPFGLVLWDGSMGIVMDIGTHRELWQGLFWSAWPTGDTVIMPVVRAENSVLPTRSQGLALSAISWTLRDRDGVMGKMAGTPAAKRATALFGATLALAQQPTIVTRHEHVGGERMLATSGPHMPVTVTQVVLRETVKAAAAAETDEREEAKWHLKTRFLVRGHWRQQRVGPGRQLRRPTYVAPYLKGPDDAPLNLTREVNVWRR